MVLTTDRKLSGRKCFCAKCGEHFNSVSSFDKHRTGKHKDRTRRCLSVKEMKDIGMICKDGWWITSEMPKSVYKATDQG